MARRKAAPPPSPLTTATVCIAGMHRSGTSMIARLLMDGGLYLGDDDELMPAAADNPEGFYERTDFVFLNDSILADLGGAWDLPPQPPASWSDGRFAPFHQTAQSLIARFADTPRWGWKDPRNSLTAPFWRDALGSVAVVFVVRNPLEVALSLQKRNHFSLALGLHLWYAYNHALRESTTPAERLITHFDAYFGDPDKEIHRLLTGLGLPCGPDDLPRLRQTAAPGMKHHRVTISQLQEANVAPEIINLYVELCEEACHASALGVSGRVQVPVSSFRRETCAPGFLGGVSRIDLWLFDLEQRNAALNAALAVHEQSRAELDGKIVERDGMILEREGRIADRDLKLQERNRTVNRLSGEVAQLQQTVSDQHAHIEQIEQRLEAAEGRGVARLLAQFDVEIDDLRGDVGLVGRGRGVVDRAGGGE
ncbi:MAG: sulfotransferase, partial [Chloroflexota bacterium]